MGSTARNRLLIVWVALTAITLLSWWIGASHGSGPIRPDAAVALGAIAITLIKVLVIVREFMDVRSAPKKLKFVTDAWLVTFGLAMLAAYFL
jgi:Prokaryotic Cytochrome C oxidase subunit IV